MGLSIPISNQINNQYRGYALYVLQSRGIPNFYDCLTPVQRIVLENSPTKPDKTLSLIGNVIRTGLYHHGDMSLSKAISKLARPFGCSDQILEGKGYFGTPVSPNPAAPRYTWVQISPWVKESISKHSDINILNSEGGHDWLHVEYPLGLFTHIVGIAVGYRSNILPRKKDDVLEYLDGKNKILKPYFKDFVGKITRFNNEESSWLIESGIEINKTRKTIRIFDLPPLIKYESFMNRLITKLDKSEINYKVDNLSKKKCDVLISLKGISHSEFDTHSGWITNLGKIIVKENVVLIKDGAVMEFDSVKEYLDSFKVHLEFVRLKRIEKDLSNMISELEYLEAKLKFLIFMSLKKRKNTEIVEFLKPFKTWISNRLSKIQIVKLSSDYIKETEKLIEETKKNIKLYKKSIKKQEKILEDSRKTLAKKNKSISLLPSSYSEEIKEIGGIDIFQEDDGVLIDEREEDAEEILEE